MGGQAVAGAMHFPSVNRAIAVIVAQSVNAKSSPAGPLKRQHDRSRSYFGTTTMPLLDHMKPYFTACATVSAAALTILSITAFSHSGRRAHFDEIDVERINIVDKDGHQHMILSNKERSPDWVASGKVIV